MFKLFKRNHAAAITVGVNTLLERYRDDPSMHSLFWMAHGRERLESWLEFTRDYFPSSATEAQALDRLRTEVAAVAEALTALPEAYHRGDNPDCLRSLVFSNVITYSAEVGIGSLRDTWATYEQALAAQGIAARTGR